MDILIKHYEVGPWKENSYFISSGNEAWLIDPGQDFDILDAYFETSKFKVKGIINTHGHFDHVGAVHEFQERYLLPFYIHSKDKRMVHQANLYRKLAGDSLITKTPRIDFFLDDNPSLTINNVDIKIHHTPGHSGGSVCFEIEKLLFSGDLFFKETIGRVDLPGGNKDAIIQSMDYIVNNFIGYKIYPGHGPSFLLTEEVGEKLKKLL